MFVCSLIYSVVVVVFILKVTFLMGKNSQTTIYYRDNSFNNKLNLFALEYYQDVNKNSIKELNDFEELKLTSHKIKNVQDHSYIVEEINILSVAQDSFKDLNSNDGQGIDNYNYDGSSFNIDNDNSNYSNYSNYSDYSDYSDYSNYYNNSIKSDKDNYLDVRNNETKSINELQLSNSVAHPMKLEFNNANLKDVLRTISLESGVNFIFSDKIANNKVNLKFSDVDWKDALQAVLETHSLGLVVINDDLIRIDNLDVINSEKKKIEETKKSTKRLRPTKMLVVRLSYAKATDLQGTLENLLAAEKNDDPRTKVQADKRTNSLIVEAVPEVLEKIKSIIPRIDLRTPQVKIETRIIEVIENDELNLGVNWSLPLRTDQSRGLVIGNLVFPNQIYSAFSVDTAVDPSDTYGRSSFDVHVGSINNLFELDLRIRAAEDQDYVKNLQNNSVVVLNNESAKANVGKTVFVEQKDKDGGTSYSPIEFNLSLKVTPQITADGSVEMNIVVENSSAVTVAGQKVPDKNTRMVETSLIRQSGETAVIGGVYTNDLQESSKGLPILSSIPIIGILFKSKRVFESKRELVIMVTPTILSQGGVSSDSDDQIQTNDYNMINENDLSNNKIDDQNTEHLVDYQKRMKVGNKVPLNTPLTSLDEIKNIK